MSPGPASGPSEGRAFCSPLWSLPSVPRLINCNLHPEQLTLLLHLLRPQTPLRLRYQPPVSLCALECERVPPRVMVLVTSELELWPLDPEPPCHLVCCSKVPQHRGGTTSSVLKNFGRKGNSEEDPLRSQISQTAYFVCMFTYPLQKGEKKPKSSARAKERAERAGAHAFMSDAQI